jgi:hypothetical protein
MASLSVNQRRKAAAGVKVSGENESENGENGGNISAENQRRRAGSSGEENSIGVISKRKQRRGNQRNNGAENSGVSGGWRRGQLACRAWRGSRKALRRYWRRRNIGELIAESESAALAKWPQLAQPGVAAARRRK